MIKKIKIFFPNINQLKLYSLIFVSILYGLSTILTIYIVSTLVSILGGITFSDLSTPVKILIKIPKEILSTNYEIALITVGVFALFIMLIFGLLKTYYVNKICATNRHYLALRLLKKSLNLNSSSLETKNFGNIKSLILDESATLITQLLRPSIEIITSSIFIVILLLNLFFYNSKLTILFIFFFGITYSLIFLFTKPNIKKHGKLRFESNQKRYAKIDDALNLKVISKILNTFDIFIKRFYEDSKKMSKHQYLFDFISASPKIIIESIIFLAVLIMIKIELGGIIEKTNQISFIETFIFFSLSALKMLPEFQKIFTSTSLLKFGNTTQKAVTEMLKTNSPKIFTQKNDGKNLIINFSCEVCFAGNEKILNDIKFKIYEGDKVAISGDSGSGKTTFINAIMGVTPIAKNNEKGLFNSNIKFGYLPQETNLFSSTVLENIAMGRFIDNKKKNEIIQYTKILFPEYQDAEIDKFLDRFIDDVTSELSVGQKQRLGLLRAVYSHPDVLVLDEFTSALDQKSENIIINFVNNFELCRAILIIGHREKSISICNKFFKISSGKLVNIDIK